MSIRKLWIRCLRWGIILVINKEQVTNWSRFNRDRLKPRSSEPLYGESGDPPKVEAGKPELCRNCNPTSRKATRGREARKPSPMLRRTSRAGESFLTFLFREGFFYERKRFKTRNI